MRRDRRRSDGAAGGSDTACRIRYPSMRLSSDGRCGNGIANRFRNDLAGLGVKVFWRGCPDQTCRANLSFYSMIDRYSAAPDLSTVALGKVVHCTTRLRDAVSVRLWRMVHSIWPAHRLPSRAIGPGCVL